jgi:hypothetical protein
MLGSNAPGISCLLRDFTFPDIIACHCEEVVVCLLADEAIPKERLLLPPSVKHRRDRNDEPASRHCEEVVVCLLADEAIPK